MFILTREEIEYCVGTKNSGENENSVSGLVYNNNFFIKAKHYELSEYEDALKDCRENFLDNEEIQIPTLMIKEEDSVSIWTQDNSYQTQNSIHTSTPSVSSTKAKSKNFGNFNLDKLAEKMRGENGLNIKTRRHKLKLYHRCFTGSEVVDWLAEKLKMPRTKAVKLGQQLMKAKIIHHVKDEHDFEDSDLFYRFYEDEDKKIWTDKLL
ncbi:Pleckstrin/ G-protein interacting-domain protein [Hyella patelloides LEGE 07179]|uniref:Pleckstrin/ G-protein interacting-domain protein n=1 Tax=Hyella patelloides LEGE 07179 TaxID=945734 RepID=A0A563VRG4_9CYAN|nr:DEP domain-containing protein [Hyella patelloides]VEP14048.1 Pleckstrin/ G-protein interacting-domain protein [Hyella patelloides LEGE 07179]